MISAGLLEQRPGAVQVECVEVVLLWFVCRRMRRPGKIARLAALLQLLVQLSLAMGFAVLAEAGLSFLGLGTQPPDPSWGTMLNDSRAYLREAPWYGLWPGVALTTLLVALNYVSDGLRDAPDPRGVNLR